MHLHMLPDSFHPSFCPRLMQCGCIMNLLHSPPSPLSDFSPEQGEQVDGGCLKHRKNPHCLIYVQKCVMNTLKAEAVSLSLGFLARPSELCGPSLYLTVLLAARRCTRWPPNTAGSLLRSQPFLQQPNHTASLLVHLVVVMSQHHAPCFLPLPVGSRVWREIVVWWVCLCDISLFILQAKGI